MLNTSYMCKNRHGIYYARFIIPKHLQSHFSNKKEIRRTLQTDSRKLAIKRARAYRVKFESIVDELMTKLEKGIYHAFEVTLKGETSITLPNGEEKTITGEIKRNLGSIDEDTSKHKEHLLKQLSTEAERQEKNAYLEHERAIREKLEQEIHQARLKAITAPTHVTAPAPTINPKLLSEYLVDYEKYQIDPNTKKGWRASSQLQKMTILNGFIKHWDKSAALFSKEDTQLFIKLAHAMPSYFYVPSHAKKFKGLTIEMLLDDEIDTSMYKTRKSSQIFNEITTVRAFLNWIVQEKEVEGLTKAVNACDRASKNLDRDSDRRAYTLEELKTLFEDNNPSDENYVKGFESKRGAVNEYTKYWLPLLGLYTGATISEVCQLHLSDIYQHKALDGSEHWIIDFNELEDKNLKKPFRTRLIPIHKVLIDLGLINYVQLLLTAGEKKLFPTVKPSSNFLYGSESNWWGEYNDDAGITDPTVVHHSFKHVQTAYSGPT